MNAWRDAVTAVVVSYNSARVLPTCLDALNDEGVGVLLVDNASQDTSASMSNGESVGVVRNRLNQGFGRAANRGVDQVRTEFALLLNPDVVLQPGAVTHLLDAAQRYPDAGLLAPRLIEADGEIFLQAKSYLAKFLTNPKGVKMTPEGDCCVPFLSGAVLLIRMSAWQDAGGFDPNIFLFYEDDDLCRRFSDLGWTLVHVHGAVAWHARGTSTPSSATNTYMRRWHLAWSRGYVADKYGMPSGLLGRTLVGCAKWLLASVLGNTQRKARYAGSVAGALAWFLRRSAVEREGLK